MASSLLPLGREEARVRIERMAAGGDGVGRLDDGIVVFTPRTAPGDLARVSVAREKRMARGLPIEILEPGPQRTDPPCPHYTNDRCGGCQLQHVTYEAQLAIKGQVIADALQRIGRRQVEPPVVEGSDRPWRYRRKLTLAMKRRGPRWIAGLHPYDNPVAVFALDDCPITQEPVVAIWKEILAAQRWFPEAKALRGAVRLLDEGASFHLEGGASWGRAREFFAQVPSVHALFWTPEGATRAQPLHERAKGSAQGGISFVQVNAGVAARLREHVLARARAHAPRVVIDGYAGTGDTAVPLARDGARVTAIELDRAAVAIARARLPQGSRAEAGRVEMLLPSELPADLVLLNPPRAGVDERVTAALAGAAAQGTRAIIYTSCNPATLARDVARLPGWRIASLAGFDMFPQTAHVETVCELVPEGA